MKIVYTESAVKNLKKLPKKTAARIVKKMEWYSEQDDPLSFAKPSKIYA